MTLTCRCGTVIRGLECEGPDGDAARAYYPNVSSVEPSIKYLATPDDFAAALAPRSNIPMANSPESKGYLNPIGGWANATAAVEKLYEWIHERGGQIVPNAELSDLIYTSDGTDVRGVRCVDGREFYAAKVILALGSWTPSHPAVKGMMPRGLITATGQTIAAIQLDKETAKRYADIPVSMHFDGSGYYSFPVSEMAVGQSNVAHESCCIPA